MTQRGGYGGGQHGDYRGGSGDRGSGGRGGAGGGAGRGSGRSHGGREGGGGPGGPGRAGGRPRPDQRERGLQGGIRRVRPVYEQGLSGVLRSDVLPETANTGLVYDRYADIWSGSPNWKPDEGARIAFLRQIIAHTAAERHLQQVKPLLNALHERRRHLWQSVPHTCPVELTLTVPLASGTGMTHALEVGFTWDRNLGVPYLPGSSLKGAVRAWATQWQDTVAQPSWRRIFGYLDDPAGDARAGTVIVHALYPTTPPQLRLDVINPHYPDYYRDSSGNIPPADWQSPNPVFFLTVPAGTRFVTALQPRCPSDKDDVQIARDLLFEALRNLGAGSKTAVGYGLFA